MLRRSSFRLENNIDTFNSPFLNQLFEYISNLKNNEKIKNIQMIINNYFLINNEFMQLIIKWLYSQDLLTESDINYYKIGDYTLCISIVELVRKLKYNCMANEHNKFMKFLCELTNEEFYIVMLLYNNKYVKITQENNHFLMTCKYVIENQIHEFLTNSSIKLNLRFFGHKGSISCRTEVSTLRKLGMDNVFIELSKSEDVFMRNLNNLMIKANHVIEKNWPCIK